jgi:hypothetical protein
MENWIDIPGYEGYQVSTFLRVRSVDRFVNNRWGRKSLIKGKILSPYMHSTGYVYVQVRKARAIHRLVALAFIPNPERKPDVNHIDGNKANYSIENLEWVNDSENQKHAFRIGLKKALKGENNPMYNRRGENSPHFGLKGGLNYGAKIVLDTQTGVFYDCAQDAALAKGIKSLNSLRQKLGGHIKNNTSLMYA